MLVKLNNMGPELQSQYRVDVNYKKKLLVWELRLQRQYFIDSEPKGEVISSKIDRLAAI